MGNVDVKCTNVQNVPIQRTLYVRPPKEMNIARGFVWKLTKLAYCMTKAESQWEMVLENWLINEAKCEIIGVV